MTTILIPVHHKGGKFGNNTELRFTIKSIEENFVGDFEIKLVCKELPADFGNYGHVFDGGSGLKTALAKAFEAHPEGAFWWYDDCVLLKPQTAEQLKVTLACSTWRTAKTSWAAKLDVVRARLLKDGVKPWDYSRPHGPYWFDQSMVEEAFAAWPNMAGKFPFESYILSVRDWPRRHGNYRQYYGAFKSPPGPNDVLLNYCDKGFTPELISWLNQKFATKITTGIMEQPKNALSFSLYGDDPKYAVGAIQNTQLAKTQYPGWDVVMHVERGHYAIQRLREEGATVIEHDPQPGHLGMRWRFETLADTSYEAVCVRDADSRVGPREVGAVNEWLASGKTLHVMRDHRQHKKPVMGGMFGMRPNGFDMAAALAAADKGAGYGDDEAWLGSKVWPKLKDDAMIHDSQDKSAHQFVGEGFVGEVVEPSFKEIGVKCVMLSARHYQIRRGRFFASIRQHAPELAEMIEVFEATPSEKMLAPPSFSKVKRIKHWWAATCDHLTIMEQSILRKDKLLMLFEDDADFSPDFVTRFWKSWCVLPKGWKAMRLGWHAHTPPTEVIPGILDRCDRTSGLMIGTLWNQRGLSRAYDHFWHRRKMIIDMAFADLRNNEPNDWYQPVKPLVSNHPDSKQQGKDT